MSGSGKSTILACIAGAEAPDAGHVTYDALTLFPPPLPLHRRPIGYLTQDAHVFPHVRVGENVRFGIRSGANAVDDAWVAELRDRLQLGSIWHQSANAISGGQARRVALARMLARRPSVVLLDEPFNGLDRPLVRDLLPRSLNGNGCSALRCSWSTTRRTCSHGCARARSYSRPDASFKTPHGTNCMHGPRRRCSRNCSHLGERERSFRNMSSVICHRSRQLGSSPPSIFYEDVALRCQRMIELTKKFM